MRSHALTTLVLALILVAPAVAEEPITATTASGRVVLLYPDGTWKYQDETPAPSTAALTRFVKAPAATEKLPLNQGKVVLHFDPLKWKQEKTEEPGVYGLNHIGGDGYAKIIAERLQIPIDSLRKIALINAKEAAPDARIVKEEKRTVNGNDVLHLQIEGTIEGIPFVYLGYYYSGKEGAVQVITFTGTNLLEEYRKDFEEFLNGFTTVK
jgi:hypothetical protein